MSERASAELAAMSLDLNNIYQAFSSCKISNCSFTRYFGTVKYLCYINYAMLFRLFELTYIQSIEVNMTRHRL